MDKVKENTCCLACGSKNLKLTLDLKTQPLANNFTTTPTEQEQYPLAVNLCLDCYHLQLTHTVNPELIYKNYLYAAGTSDTLKKYSDWFANFVNEMITGKYNNILDIGCNDGTQLNSFKKIGFNTYGIDPAENLITKEHNTVCGFFGQDILSKLWKNCNFDAITAQNVFAHNPNPYDFLETVKTLMNDNTLLFIQTSQADMVLNNEFDTIYHEHINFFNVNSMNKLVARAGLNLIDVVKTPIHGNSYVFVIGKTKSNPYKIQNIIDMEKKLTQLSTYINWHDIVVSNMVDLKETIKSYRNWGYTIVGYGAAAKGNTLLNYVNEKLDYIIDDSPLKQGMYTPGLNIPIVPISHLQNYSNTDKIIFIPLAWNFFNEINYRIKKARDNQNDKFLKYFPKVEINV